MPKYYPIIELEEYKYYEADSKTKIYASLKVDLSANETIDIHQPIQVNPFTHIVELYVVSGGGHTSDWTWNGNSEVLICSDEIYEPTANLTLAQKQTLVRDKINDLLAFYNSNVFKVIATVHRPNVAIGERTNGEISGGGIIQVNA